MKQTTTKHLYAYWNDVRGERIAPKRFEIEPSQIAAILPDTFMLERIDSVTSRFRLAGTRICETFGAEFRGVNIFEFFGPEDRVTLQRQISVMAQQGAVGLFKIEGRTESGKIAGFEIVVLPLIHTRDVIDRFLGGIVPDQSYPWLGLEPLGPWKLVSHDLIWPNGRPQAVLDATHRQAPFLPHIRNARIVRSEGRQFRVYEGGLNKPDGEQ